MGTLSFVLSLIRKTEKDYITQITLHSYSRTGDLSSANNTKASIYAGVFKVQTNGKSH